MTAPSTVKMWPIWIEGYAATGERQGAAEHGEWPGETFAEACAAWARENDIRGDFNADRLTFWGRRMFDNEAEARRAFG